jgi:hypothetical protein
LECTGSVVLFTIFYSMATGEGREETCGELGTLIYETKEASDVQKSLTRHQLLAASVIQAAFTRQQLSLNSLHTVECPHTTTVVYNSKNAAAVIDKMSPQKRNTKREDKSSCI